MLTRRDFGKITLAALPLSSAFAKINSKINGVQLGVQTYSFRDLPPEGIVDAVIKAMTEIGLGECEVFGSQFEPVQPRIGRGPGDPEAVADAEPLHPIPPWSPPEKKRATISASGEPPSPWIISRT